MNEHKIQSEYHESPPDHCHTCVPMLVLHVASLFETIGSPHVNKATVRRLGAPSYLVSSLLVRITGIKCGMKWRKFRGSYCVMTTHCTVDSKVFSALPAF